MFKRFLLSSLFAAASLGSQSNTLVGKLLVLNPQVSSQEAPIEIQPEHVAGILGDLMGFPSSSDHQVELPSNFKDADHPLSNFLLVVDGAPLQSSSVEDAFGLNPSLSFNVRADGQESGKDLISRMISGKSSKGDVESATLGDLLCQYHENSAIFSVSTHPELASLPLPHEELSKENPQWNLVSGQVDLLKSKIGVSGKKFKGGNKMFSGLFPTIKTTQDSQESSLYLREEKALLSVLGSIQQSELSPLFKDNSPDSITFISSSLKEIREKFGADSPQYKSAWKGFLSAILKVRTEYMSIFGTSAPFEVLFVEGEKEVAPLSRGRRSIGKRDYTNPANQCFPSLEECQNVTSSCSGFGECILVKERREPAESCYRCKCGADYAGESCEFINIVAPFHIIFWVSLVLLLSLYLVCYALAFMDPGTDTLLFRTSSKPKRE